MNRDKWIKTGLLEKCESLEQEKELSELLEQTANFIIERNKQDFISSVMLPAIVRLYYDKERIFPVILVQELEKADKLNFYSYNKIDEEMDKMMIAIQNYKNIIPHE